MTIRNLDHLFRPSSVAVIGASVRPRSLGNIVVRNLVAAGFAGDILPVNPRHNVIEGLTAYPSVRELPLTPDLAVICTPPATIPGLIAELATRGTRAAIVLTAGLSAAQGSDGRSIQTLMLEAARPHLFRILGPNCVGLLVPGLKLNASFAHIAARPGQLAFVSQSGALCTAMLDWADSRAVGFSYLVSLGNSADVDFGDVIDYLASEPSTNAIVLYIESVTNARKFLSAARAAARLKPVIAVKGGRAPEGARAALSHTGAMSGSDAVYDAVFRRAGMLRVQNIDELFDAVETLTHVPKFVGERIAIMTNGGGPGVLAADAVTLAGGTLATLTDATVARLDSLLPATWSRANPIDIIGDATPERFRSAADAVVSAPEVDAVLFTYAPTAIADSVEIARTTVEAFRKSPRPVFANWLGGTAMEAARHIFEEAGIPTFDTPERAVRALLNLVEYRRNQAALLETPSSSDVDSVYDRATVQKTIATALGEGRSLLSEPEAKAVLAAFQIPVARTLIARSPDDAVRCAREIGFPVALKLMSRDVTHKSDVGGVVLDLANEADVLAAADSIRRRLAEVQPAARLDGYTVQDMVRRPGAFELIAGAAVDPTYGPILLFGHGGTAVELINDRAIGLPPLNDVLARDLIGRTRIARLLGGYRNRPPSDVAAIAKVLERMSRIVTDFPEIVEIDINPLLADEHGVCALDARIRIVPTSGAAAVDRLAIQPYPRELEESIELGGQRILLRPIRPEDEPAHRKLLARSAPEDLRFRFFTYRRAFSHDDLARWTQIDYDREMAFIATVSEASGAARTLGVVRSIVDPDNFGAEFAILIDGHMQGRGLGRLLMRKMIDYLRARGTRRLIGQVLADNARMLGLLRDLGFTLTPEGTIHRAEMELNPQGVADT